MLPCAFASRCRTDGATRTRLARSITVDECPAMRTSLLIAACRVLAWCSVVLLAVLSLLPSQAMVRTGLPGRLEHFVAYAGSAAVAMAGYGASRGSMQIIGGLWVYAGILEYLQHFSPGRHPSLADFAASAFGAMCGGLAVAFLWHRASDQPR
jgi:VanZ family protein